VELRHLRYFAAVAETLHFGRAAERLHMAQPPLSQAIRQLEAEMGVTLFTRTTRHVALTPAGAAFEREVRRILQSIEDGVTRARRIGDGHAGVLQVAFTGTAAFEQLPRIARTVQQQLPEVVLEFHTDLLTPAQEEGLLHGQLDLGVLRPPLRSADLVTRPIASEPLLVVMAEDHPLAGAGDLQLSHLRDEAFVLYAAPGSVVNAAVARSCLAAGFTPRVAYRVEGTSVLLALVAGGVGVALVPASVQATSVEGAVYREVAGVEHVDLAIAHRRDDDSPLLHRLLRTLEAAGFFADAPGDPTTTRIPA
jgi:DNA-binding transcriptional LysR family regulator